jgi:hypothetical protein
MELLAVSLILGAFFILLFFYISKIFQQQPAEVQPPASGKCVSQVARHPAQCQASVRNHQVRS